MNPTLIWRTDFNLKRYDIYSKMNSLKYLYTVYYVKGKVD